MYKISNLEYKKIFFIEYLEINPQDFLIIYGESGSGKSTFIKLLCGQDYDYQGSILLNDFELKTLNKMEIMKKISMMGQRVYLLKETISDEIKEICSLFNLIYDEVKIKELLKIVNLDKDIHENVNLFSGGEKERIAILRTLYLDKQIIILDEPTAALDKITTQKLMANLEKYIKDKEKTLIMITHNQDIIKNTKYKRYEVKKWKQ